MIWISHKNCSDYCKTGNPVTQLRKEATCLRKKKKTKTPHFIAETNVINLVNKSSKWVKFLAFVGFCEASR